MLHHLADPEIVNKRRAAKQSMHKNYEEKTTIILQIQEIQAN